MGLPLNINGLGLNYPIFKIWVLCSKPHASGHVWSYCPRLWGSTLEVTQKRTVNMAFVSCLGWLLDWLVFFSTNTLYCAIRVWDISCKAGEQDKYAMKQYIKPKSHKRSSAWALWITKWLPRRNLSIANHLASTDNLTRTTKRQTHKCKLTEYKKAPINSRKHTQKPMLRERERERERERASFSRLLRHPARKWSGSILSISDPAPGVSKIEAKGQRS